jgi:hypothetical protein
MYELKLADADLKTVNGHRYYVFKTPAHPHKNQENRPATYAKSGLDVYKGTGAKSQSPSKLLPSVFTEVNSLMTALLEYGKTIDDWSMLSAYVQNGYRPDDASQGRMYLHVINDTIAQNPKMFKDLTFPEGLNTEAEGVLGKRGDPRREAFRDKLANSPGWSKTSMEALFQIVDRYYAPRGFNPHATGLVFDLDFMIWGGLVPVAPGHRHPPEVSVGADPRKNPAALQSAVGMWLNQYAMQFHFDSYDTSAEIWHMEFRKPKP